MTLTTTTTRNTTTPGPALFELDDLCIQAPKAGAAPVTLIEGVSLRLERGKVLGLIGESGAGKSTLGLTALAMLRGAAWVARGAMRFDGQDMLAMGARARADLRGRRVAYVAQSAASAFNPGQRLIDQVIETSLRIGAMTRPEARARAIALFDRLGLPDPSRFGEKYPHQASGGQLQRAMTAMAMCARPDLIVFDEPTTALDVTTQIEVLRAMRQAIRDEGMAALYISHDLALVAQIADAIMVLRGGRMVEQGPTQQVIERPAAPYTQALIAARNLRHAPREGQKPILRLEGLAAGYGKLRVIEGLTLDLPQGGTLAVIGESGSGKSTLGRVIAGLTAPQAGRILFQGRPLAPLSRKRPLADLRDIQLIHQIPDLALNPARSVGAAIAEALGAFRGLKGAPCQHEVARLMQLVELDPDLASRKPHALSGGQKQRICIARALAAQPKLIVCDEVTSALDPLIADGVLRLLARLQRDAGLSYLFITHDFSAVEALADAVAVMRAGALVAAGPVSQVLHPPMAPYTEKLLRAVPQLRLGWLDGLDAAAGQTSPAP